MKHFDIDQWSEYVRGFAASATAEQMRAHLELGCPRCAKTVGTLQKLLAVVAAPPMTRDVPDYLVHNVGTFFKLHRPEKVTLASIVAQLMYDSFCQPETAGVRNLQRSGRHVVYRAGEFCVDLRLEREARGGRVTLVGQVGHSGVPDAAIANLRVMLMAGHRMLTQTTSNEYGEFHFEYLPGEHLRLQISVDAQGRLIEIKLNELSLGNPVHDDVLMDQGAAVQRTRRNS